MLRRLAVLVLALSATAVWMAPSPAGARPAPQAAWSAIASPPKRVAQTRAVFLKNKIYMPGGWLNGFSHMYGGMQIYSTASNTWTQDKQPIPSGALAQSAVCTDGARIYVLGGIAFDGNLLSTMQIYDPSKPKGARWSSGPNIHTAPTGDLRIRESGCAWIGGKLYLFGGDAQSDTGAVSGTVDLTWVYTPATGLWSDTGFHMNGPNWIFGYTSNATTAYAAGGVDDPGAYLRDVQSFTPSSGWSALTKLPVPKGAPAGTGLRGAGLGILGSNLAVFGGGAAGGPTPLAVRTLLCPLPCGAGDAWTNAHKDLATPREEFAWASGGATPTLYAIDGVGTSGFVSTAEKTT